MIEIKEKRDDQVIYLSEFDDQRFVLPGYYVVVVKARNSDKIELFLVTNSFDVDELEPYKLLNLFYCGITLDIRANSIKALLLRAIQSLQDYNVKIYSFETLGEFSAWLVNNIGKS